MLDDPRKIVKKAFIRILTQTYLMSKRREVRQKLRDRRRSSLPIAIYETSVMVDIVLGNMSTSLLRNAQANFNVVVPTITMGEVIKVLDDDRRISEELRTRALGILNQCLSFIDEIRSIDQEALDNDIALVNGFFKRFDDRVGPMDRLILAGSINIQPERFVTLDHDFLDLREEISREIGITVKTALP